MVLRRLLIFGLDPLVDSLGFLGGVLGFLGFWAPPPVDPLGGETTTGDHGRPRGGCTIILEKALGAV